MTLEEIDDLLPNGFHDAQLLQLRLNYEKAEIVLEVNILWGLPDDPVNRGRYRRGELKFGALQFCSIEPPQPNSSFKHPGSVWFVYERMEDKVIPESLLNVLEKGVQKYSLFVRDWLSNIQIVAGDVALLWIDSAP